MHVTSTPHPTNVAKTSSSALLLHSTPEKSTRTIRTLHDRHAPLAYFGYWALLLLSDSHPHSLSYVSCLPEPFLPTAYFLLILLSPSRNTKHISHACYLHSTPNKCGQPEHETYKPYLLPPLHTQQMWPKHLRRPCSSTQHPKNPHEPYACYMTGTLHLHTSVTELCCSFPQLCLLPTGTLPAHCLFSPHLTLP